MGRGRQAASSAAYLWSRIKESYVQIEKGTFLKNRTLCMDFEINARENIPQGVVKVEVSYSDWKEMKEEEKVVLEAYRIYERKQNASLYEKAIETASKLSVGASTSDVFVSVAGAASEAVKKGGKRAFEKLAYRASDLDEYTLEKSQKELKLAIQEVTEVGTRVAALLQSRNVGK